MLRHTVISSERKDKDATQMSDYDYKILLELGTISSRLADIYERLGNVESAVNRLPSKIDGALDQKADLMKGILIDILNKGGR
jgi:hypothetical protein